MKRTIIVLLVLLATYAGAQQTDYSSYQPMPIPEWKPPLQHTGQEHYLVEYDCATGIERIVDTNQYLGNMPFAYTDPFIPPGAAIDEEIIGQKNFTDLSHIQDPTPFPWRANVKLFMTFPNNGNYVGSGVLINQQYVLTAAHCIYSAAKGGWASSIEVVPAYYSGNKPFGSAYSSNLYSWTGWTASEDWDWDMGYIKLNTAIGTQTGYLGFGYNNNNSFFQTSTFHNPGYPAASPYNGQLMYYWYGTYDQVWTHLLYFNQTCYGGQSGSGSYHKDQNDIRHVYAVLSHSSSQHGTGHVRINQTRFNSIQNQINSTSYVMEEIGENGKLMLWPNPAAETLNIAPGGNPGSCTITITDMSGRQVMHRSVDFSGPYQNISVENLHAGFYAISVTDGKNISNGRFIKR